MHPQKEILTGIKHTIFTKLIRVYLVYKLLKHEALAYSTGKEDSGLLESKPCILFTVSPFASYLSL